MRTLERPPWLKVGAPLGESYDRTERIITKHGLNTVCRAAICPNRRECYDAMTATFMILGRNCTRSCGFCAVDHGLPERPDQEEPGRVAGAITELGLEYVVITSVTRDDLPDGGASHFARTIRAIREKCPMVTVEVLIPDLKGDPRSIATVVGAGPDVISHNIETVPSLYDKVRTGASYIRSLRVISTAREMSNVIKIKSGIMLGLGETSSEVESVFRALARAGCDYLTIGQYLKPSSKNVPVFEYVHPDRFECLKEAAEEMGFEHVEAGPLVRSSYHASRVVR